MDIREVDLNLLVIFDVMATTCSVGVTAETVGLSQPATSSAIARLRVLFEDPLFVRSGKKMACTPRALALAPSVRRLVDIVNDELLPRPAFDPSASDRSFVILTPDIGEVAFLPGVLQRLRQEAPQVRLEAVAKPRTAAAEALASGAADLAVGFFPDLRKAGFFQQGLFKTSYSCIACAQNEEVGSRMTMRQYLSAKHIVVRPDGREHAVDKMLEDKGLERHVTLAISHFMSLLALLPGTDLIATVPDDIATVLEDHVSLKRIAVPFLRPEIYIQQYWHRRVQNDPANRWLRGVFHEVNRRDGVLKRKNVRSHGGANLLNTSSDLATGSAEALADSRQARRRSGAV